MKEIFQFLRDIGSLKEKGRRGWVLHDVENPETTAEHTFHTAFLVWLLGRKKEGLNLERAMKIALIHDICEVYSPDLTSYDAAALKEEGEVTKEEIENINPYKGRPTTKQRKQMAKIKDKLEKEGMDKLIAGLEEDLKQEIYSLWGEYEKGLTEEGRFVKQADRVINLFQGMEYYKKHNDIECKLWIRRAKEVIDDPEFLKLLSEIEEETEKK